MLQRFFARFQRSDAEQQLAQELRTLEEQAQGAAWDYRAHLYARAGDLCVSAGDRDRALAYYGQAIDAYLEFGYYDVAANVCRKVLEVAPDVVRTRCTLAFLSLGKGLLEHPFRAAIEDARGEIGEYVRAARRAGQESVAAQRLRMMAEATDSHEVRELIGESLLELGDPVAADEVFGAIHAERNQLRTPSPEDQRERWARVLRLSVAPPAAAADAAAPPAVELA